MSHIGVFMNLAKDDPEATARVSAMREGLEKLGRTESKIDCRFGAGNADLRRKNAAELVDLAPEIILASSGPIMTELQQVMKQAKRTIPIVFAGVIDPVGTGRIASAARPDGNATGFASIEFSIGMKWLALLKLIVPRLARALVIHDASTPAGRGQLGAIEGAAKALRVKLSPVDVSNASAIERGIEAFAGQADGGLIVTAATLAAAQRQQIITLAARHRLPAVYPNRMYATDGGLIAYGPITVELYRSAAGYVDRILKGEKPGNLPVPVPAKYELDINLKTSETLGLEVPPALLFIANKVIE
jgi:putative ABC transport system substrate-binding protein